MSLIKKKLQSKRGASIAIALIFFLICAVTGGIVLTSASANTGTLNHMYASNQDYLTVSSAARLLREEIDELSFTATEVSVDGWSEDTDFIISRNGSNISKAVLEWAQHHFESSPYSAPSTTFTIEAEGLDAVKAELTMSASYVISIKLSLGDASDAYKMTLLIPTASKKAITEIDDIGTEESPSEQITEITTIVWGRGTIAKGGD